MNWYKTKTREDTLKKIASDSWDYKNQKNIRMEMGDTMRYTMDSHDINISMNKTNEEIIISLTMGSAYVGTYILDCFWSFNTDEEGKASKLFNKIGEAIRPILKKFIEEKIPTSLLCPFIKKSIHEMSKEYLIKTNIPSINYSYDIPPEEDWRSSIYGNRYLKYKEESFNQYLNSSIYNQNNTLSGKFSL